jgi:chondroitin AC lyase
MLIFHPTPARLFFVFVLLSVGAHGDDDFAKIKQQRIAYLVHAADSGHAAGAASPAEQAGAWLKSQQVDGSWSDIDYSDQTRGGWKTLAHLQRAARMALIYAREREAGTADPALRDAVLSAFQFWTQKDFRNPNWWNNDIGAPLLLEQIMLLMEKDMDAVTRVGGMQILDRLSPEGTGQNLVWENGIQLDKALLAGDPAGLRRSRDIIFGELKITRDEGIQPDFSFHQHGPQQQMGNYGLSFAREMTAWATIFRGTSLALVETQLGILRDYLLRGEAPVVWRGTMDIGSCGRQLFPNIPVLHGKSVLAALDELTLIDPAHTAEYQAASARAAGTFPGDDPGAARNIDYYTSDYLVHRRAGFAAYLKMCSRRVIGTEVVNDENLSGRYLADGALWVYESGLEEKDIFPVLDWRRIPGVTCAQAGPTLRPAGMMDTDFAGGVSDGTNGAAGLDYNRDGVTAKKSWFFLGGRIVCLGAGITGTADAPVDTSLDLRFPPGTVVIDGHPGGNGIPQAMTGVGWICAGTRGYVFAQPQTVWIGTQPQQGSWTNIYKAGSPEKITSDIFSIWLDHGIRPHDATYAYTLLPATTPAQVKSFAAQPGIEIVSNTTAIQAVRDRDAHLLAAIFFTPGQLQADGQVVSVDQPCALLLHESTGKITVADPTEKESRVTVTVGGVAKPFDFPQGGNAGASSGD